MSRGVHKLPSDAQRHTVATLVAAGRSPSSICIQADLTIAAYRLIVNEEGFAPLLAEKQVALTLLMRGAA